MRFYAFLCVFILSISVVTALETTLTTINDCYNVSIHVRLNEGNRSAFAFYNCKDVGKNDWFCACNGAKEFNITMITNNDWINHPRDYRITVKYNIINNYTSIINFMDYAKYTEVTDIDDNYGFNSFDTVYVPEYVTRTIEKNSTIIREINKTIYKNNTIYIENTSKIAEFTKNIAEKDKEIYILEFIIIIAAGIFLFYVLYKKFWLDKYA